MNARLLAAVSRTPPPADGGDADLLRRFLAVKDDSAFAELVRRYSRLVWSVCRNTLPQDADAEDAFQAVFVALARNATQVRDGRAIGGWLHGVAVRVCLKLKRGAARRAARERAAAGSEPAQPVADSRWDAALAAVHAEVAALPEIYRVPFVLCCLEGRGVTDAAAQLGWKLGTLSGRLTRAKEMVLDRLAARGFAPAVAGLAVAVAAADAPAKLLTLTAGLAGGNIPITVMTLARGATEVTVTKKLLAAAVLVGGVGFGWYATADAQSPVRGSGGPAAASGPGGPGGMAVGGEGGAVPPQGFPGMPRTGPDSPITGDVWAYKYVSLTAAHTTAAYTKEFKDNLTSHGSVGWEYVGSVPGTTELIFKRQNRTGAWLGTGVMGAIGGGGFGTTPGGGMPAGEPGGFGGMGAGMVGGRGGPASAGGGKNPAGPGGQGLSRAGGGAPAQDTDFETTVVKFEYLTADEAENLARFLFPNLAVSSVAKMNSLVVRGTAGETKDFLAAMAKIDDEASKSVKPVNGVLPKPKK